MRTLSVIASSLLFVACHTPAPAEQPAPNAAYFDSAGRDDVLTGDVKMIENATPKGRFKVWVERTGNNPKIKGSQSAQPAASDFVLTNGRIFVGDSTDHYVEALAIRGDRIVATGSTETIAALAGSRTKRLDLTGRLVIAGLNDAHFHHFVEPATAILALEGGLEPSWQDVTVALRAAIAEEPKGIPLAATVGERVFDDPAATRNSLDEIAPRRAVILSSWTGHYYILNTTALELLHVREEEPNPVGGEYVRDSRGVLTGVVLEHAALRVARNTTGLAGDEDALRQTRDVLNAQLRLGITTIQNMPVMSAERSLKLIEAAQVPIRVRIMPLLLTDTHGSDLSEGRTLPRHPSPLITVSGRKWIIDGTPIEHSAAMRKPYADRPTTSGKLAFTERQIRDLTAYALQADEQLIVHVVGDRAAEAVMDAMDATGGAKVWASRRTRFEHGDGMMPDLMERATRLGIIVVQNPTHLTIGDLLVRRFGSAEAALMQPMKSLADKGVPLALGSDGPVTPWLDLMLAAMCPGKPAQALSMPEAVIAHTRTAAFAEFAEKDKGTLESGKLADLVVLSQDIFKVPLDAVARTESVLTMVGGKIVYDAGAPNIR
jgi:hypothetical protein